ncbi:DUF2779 domain-containing protein [Mycoplasma sp. 1654_15]|uniref:DUF2779 domain-containing protein n=1 Tax=Mycoplasma sp. 1654_15 TaxID=2725994 RepID=UPI001449357B|nr:DUF2779 domain-containing protein [Mycoplasma sp. 1654_15]QJB71340.1 DUF2779 domain-containing protein [Mycoplasma sp. 1654_15]
MTKKEYITYRQYFNFYTSQPFFVWHTLGNSKSLSDSELEFSDDDEEEDEEKSIWNFDSLLALDEENEGQQKFFEVNYNVFREYPTYFKEYIEKKYPNHKIYTIKSKSTEEKIQETKEAINSNAYDILLFPVFEYRSCIARPDVIFIKDKKISTLKLSTSHKRVDLIKLNWQFWITRRALKDVFRLETISLFILDIFPDMKKYDKPFKEVFNLNIAKNTKSLSKYEDFEEKKVIKQQGMTLEEYEKNPLFLNISNFVKDNIIPSAKGRKTKTIKAEGSFLEIDKAIDAILEAKNQSTIEELSKKDNGDFKKSLFFNEVLSEKHPELSGFSGKFLPAKEIIKTIENPAELNDLKQNEDYKFFNQKNQIWIVESEREKLNNFITNFLIKDARIIWFDFESISLPYPSIDYTLPYQQIVFQVSIIESVNDQIIEKDFDQTNLVFDPINYTWRNFLEIIESIYANKADFYIVFNQGYEKTRLNEMLKIIKIYYDQDNSCVDYYKYEAYVKHIIENIIDLQIPFQQNWIKLSDLKGFYSIKKIEKFITEHKYDTRVKITPYKLLEVKNGMEAMNQGTLRYLNKTGEHVWQKVKKNLQKYCQNDVLAMLMVWSFIQLVLKI